MEHGCTCNAMNEALRAEVDALRLEVQRLLGSLNVIAAAAAAIATVDPLRRGGGSSCPSAPYTS